MYQGTKWQGQLQVHSYCQLFLSDSKEPLQTLFGSDFGCAFLCVEWGGVHVYGDAGGRGRCSPADLHPGT